MTEHASNGAPLGVQSAVVRPAAAPVAGHGPTNHQHHARTRLQLTIFATVLAVVLLSGFLITRHFDRAAEEELKDANEHAASASVAVDAVHVRRSSADGALDLPGDCRPFYQSTLFARTSGYVSKWLVDIGDRVKQGQVLALIETPELDDQLTESRAKLTGMIADAHVAETTAAFAKVSFGRWDAAGPEGVVSAQERDQKKSELDSANAKLEAAQSAVALGQAEVKRLETLASFKQVVAPFDGVITERHIDIGMLVTAGSTTNTTPLFTLSQADQIRVFVDVPQTATATIKVGMRATVTLRERPDAQYEGVVDRTAASIDPHSRTLKTEVLVPNPELTLLPGTYVQVRFETARADPPLRIPASALVNGPGGAEAAVVAPDGTVSFHPIRIARDLGNAIEVEDGLSPTDVVALNVGNQVTAGQKVDAHLIEEAGDGAPAPGHGPAATRPTLAAKTPTAG